MSDKPKQKLFSLNEATISKINYYAEQEEISQSEFIRNLVDFYSDETITSIEQNILINRAERNKLFEQINELDKKYEETQQKLNNFKELRKIKLEDKNTKQEIIHLINYLKQNEMIVFKNRVKMLCGALFMSEKELTSELVRISLDSNN
jgi:hypothetical protein